MTRRVAGGNTDAIENTERDCGVAVLRSFDAVFARCGRGIVLLTPDAKVAYATRSTESILGTAELGIREQSLWVKRRACKQRLAAAVARAIAGEGSDVSLHFRGETLHVSVVPVGVARCVRQPGGLAVALVLQLPATLPSGENRLPAFAAAYDITPTELRVLDLLLRDCAPKHIAERLGVGIRTVRTHLSNLYYKTQTRSQHQLVARVLRAVTRR